MMQDSCGAINGLHYTQEITKRYGRVKRARGPYLYTEKGVRLVDMFQESGKAILGWGFGKSRLELKNALERGAIGSFDSLYERKLLTCLRKLFSGNGFPQFSEFRWYASKEKLHALTGGDFAVWKPWQNVESSESQTEKPFTLIISPFPWAGEIYIVGFTDDAIANKVELQSDSFAPPLLAAITRAFYDLVAELPKRGEKHFSLYDDVVLNYWERNGAYLIPRVSEKDYADFFIHCLDNMLVISPAYETASVVPFSVNMGDFSSLKKNAFTFS